jgi:glycyl-tRNA synthetase
MEKENLKKVSMEDVVSLCKRRGFVFQGSEIYGGLAGTYDYGHYGTLLKENIKNAWIKSISQERDDVYLLDSAIFMHPTTWKASGHVDNFDDPLVDCKKCQSRIRADHLLESFGVNADKQSLEFVNVEMDKLRAEKKLVCPTCGSADLTPARSFSLMVKSNFGSPVDTITDENVVYLRPETCGGIYLQYKNTLDSMHPKLPFGIAQVGKAFRNEIVTKQYIFRTREFEQMEMQYFLHPDHMQAAFKEWQEYRWKWYLAHGIDEARLKWYKHEKLAHYASDAYDIEYNFYSLGGFKEIEGVHARGDWDLSQHSKFSGENLTYFDEERKERYTPHIMETSTGLARQMLMFIDNAYQTDLQNGEERVYLKFHKDIAPIKIAILPLMKNKVELTDKAKNVYNQIRKNFRSEYDDSGSIGKRYRRQDEIGTPFCATVDYQTLEDDTVTIRDRDTAEQKRVAISEIESYIR